MRKFLPSPVPAIDSSSTPPKKRRNSKKHISKEALELWMKTHPNEYFLNAPSYFGISYTSIIRFCKKYGIGGRKIRYPREALAIYLSSHPDATYKEIAEHFGGASGAAKLAVNRYGLDYLKSPRGKWRKNQKS